MEPERSIRIHLEGRVQGVGFRPWFYRQATALGLVGRAYNDGSALVAICQGKPSSVAVLLERLQAEPPPAASIRHQAVEDLAIQEMEPVFRIVSSAATGGQLSFPLDLSPCQACLAEMADPVNRRYRYPFTSCADCGPRFSILSALPFDRENTTLADFPLCQTCQQEYDTPSNRRFHAQTIGCAVCGPRCWFQERQGEAVAENPIERALSLLQAGGILALKGVGGFQLAVDALNADAVARLRQRKQRPHKPFALMAGSLAQIEQYAMVSEPEAQTLCAPAAPIVLLKAKECFTLANGVAPGLDRLGFMLPSSPLHVLLLRGLPGPLVMTSGNRAGAAICISNDEALETLAPIADGFLLHDRVIQHRLDDSVCQWDGAGMAVIRLGRGLAPLTWPLRNPTQRTAIAVGGDLKNTAAMVSADIACLSPHNGELLDLASQAAFQARLGWLRSLSKTAPRWVTDQHPDYVSRRMAVNPIGQPAMPVSVVQHHHAHLAACLAEHQWPLDAPPVFGIILDGVGYGEPEAAGDHNLWGSEVLLGGYAGVTRLACLVPVAMPGGDVAAREPWRNAIAHLQQALGWRQVQAQYGALESIARLSGHPVEGLLAMIAQQVNAPLSSSCGRLFDAVAVLLMPDELALTTYEGQAAIRLQQLAEQDAEEGGDPYPFLINRQGSPWALDVSPMWAALLDDLAKGTRRSCIARRFHATLAAAFTQCLLRQPRQDDVKTVVLSGGVFQNTVLLQQLRAMLMAQGKTVLHHQRVPCNDGGLALGQLAVAASQEFNNKGGRISCV